jgi:hypothetical protein
MVNFPSPVHFLCLMAHYLRFQGFPCSGRDSNLYTFSVSIPDGSQYKTPSGLTDFLLMSRNTLRRWILSRDRLKIAPLPSRHSRYRHTSNNAALPLIGLEDRGGPSFPHTEDRTPSQKRTNQSDWPVRREDISGLRSGPDETGINPLDSPIHSNSCDA